MWNPQLPRANKLQFELHNEFQAKVQRKEITVFQFFFFYTRRALIARAWHCFSSCQRKKKAGGSELDFCTKTNPNLNCRQFCVISYLPKNSHSNLPDFQIQLRFLPSCLPFGASVLKTSKTKPQKHNFDKQSGHSDWMMPHTLALRLDSVKWLITNLFVCVRCSGGHR